MEESLIFNNSILKILKSLVSPDTIKKALHSIIQNAIDYKKNIPLDSEKGETQIQAAQYEINGKTYFAVQILNDENKVLRFEKIKLIDDLVDDLLKNI